MSACTGSPLHRVIAGSVGTTPFSPACPCRVLTLLLLPLDSFMVQGGDFTDRNGKGGESIYGPSFE